METLKRLQELERLTADWDENTDMVTTIALNPPLLKRLHKQRWVLADASRRDIEAGLIGDDDALKIGLLLARIDKMIVSAESYQREHPTIMECLEIVRGEARS